MNISRYRAVIVLVVLTLVGGIFSGVALLTATPASASSCARHIKPPCCPSRPVTEVNGEAVARCYTPGDDAEWGAALYMCDQGGLMSGVWATPWHNVKACMDADLVINDSDRNAIQAHLVDLYIFQRGTKIVEKFWHDAYLAGITLLANARKWTPWIHRILVYGAPVFCTGVGALVAGPYGAAASAIGCSWAVQYILNKEGL